MATPFLLMLVVGDGWLSAVGQSSAGCLPAAEAPIRSQVTDLMSKSVCARWGKGEGAGLAGSQRGDPPP